MMIHRFRPTAGILPALALGLGMGLVLAGCANTPRTVTHVQSQNDVFRYVITTSLPLEVYGNPFPGIGAQAVAEASAAGMSGLVNRRPLTFIAVPPGQGGSGYRTVLFLGSGGGVVTGDSLCQGLAPTETRAGDTIRASAALCRQGELVAWAEGWLGAQASPESPAYRALMDRLADAVFARTRDRDDKGDSWPV